MAGRPRQTYTTAVRRQWILDNLPLIEEEEWTYDIIKQKVKSKFGLPSLISNNTVHRDLVWARSKASQKPLTDEEERLLLPESFPEWRRKAFEYDTSTTQFALYYVLRGLALKEDLPDWVIAHFELPADINEDILAAEKLLSFILLMAPRHGKTMTMIHGLIHLYIIEPNLRVIYCQGKAKTSEQICEQVMIELEDEDNEFLQKYGPFKSDKRRWSAANGIILAGRTRHSATASFQPVGITSNVRSLDADILVIDDPQDQERAESEAVTASDYRKITTEFMTRREPHTPMLGVGSHLPTEFGDVWTQIEENLEDINVEGQLVVMNKRPAHHDERCKVFSGEADEHDDNCLEWAAYRGYNFLMAQKALLGEELYDAVYQQDARLEGVKPFPPQVVKEKFGEGGIRDFQRSWKQPLQNCTKVDEGTVCGGQLYMAIGFDPARGKSKSSSFTALAVIQGCIKCRTFYLIDYHFERVSSDAHPGMITSWAKSFNPDMVRIEINAYQEALARNTEVREASQKYSFLLDEWETDDRKNTPELGIPMLANSMKWNQFSVPFQNTQDEDYGRELEKSLIRYPKKPNDIPMAVWLAAGGVIQLWDVYANLDPIYLKGRLDNVPQYLLDGSTVVDMGLVGRE